MRADAGVALPGPLAPGQEGAPGRAASADSRCAGLVASAPGAAARRCGCVLGATSTPSPPPCGLGRAPLQEPAPEEDGASGGVGVGVAEEPASSPGGPDPAVCSVGLGEAVTFPGPASDWPEAPCCHGRSRPHGAPEARFRSTRGHQGRRGRGARRGGPGTRPVPHGHGRWHSPSRAAGRGQDGL